MPTSTAPDPKPSLARVPAQADPAPAAGTGLPHHIVIVGGGAGGLVLATRLGDRLGRRGKARITLVDCALTHVWKPLLHEIAAGTLHAAADGLDYLVHAARHHFTFELGRMSGLDRSARDVALSMPGPSTEGVFRRLFDGPRPTHAELVRLATAPES